MNEGLKSAATTWTQCVDLLTAARPILAKLDPNVGPVLYNDIKGHMENLTAELANLSQCVTKTVALMDEGNPAKVEEWTDNSLLAAQDSFNVAEDLARLIRARIQNHGLSGPWA